MSKDTYGRFVWFDLMSTEPEAAIKFYSDVVGWTTQKWEGGDPNYTMFVADGTPIGGVNQLSQEAADMGAPTHWLSYVTIADVEGVVEKIKASGGTVLKEAMTMPGVGTFAIIQDPQGGVIAPFTQEKASDEPDDVIPNGWFSWHELATTDRQGAIDFYYPIFGWVDSDQMDMGPGGIYQMYKAPGMSFALGGIHNKAPETPATSWLYYIKVSDLDQALTRVAESGGKVLNGPMDVPGGDRVAQCMDPQGGAFALHGK